MIRADSAVVADMVHEGLQQLVGETFAVGGSARSEEFRIIYNAPRGAGVVHE